MNRSLHPDFRQALDRWMRTRRPWMDALLGDLIRARTENPPGHESRAARPVMQALRQFGIACRQYAAKPGRANVIATVGRGHPRVLVACHLDTVPAGDGWSMDPFVPHIRKGRMYGRGASDNKGPIPPCLALMGWLKQYERALRGTFIFAAAADEERGSEFGLEYLMRKGVLHADFAVIPDIGERMRAISIGEKGALFLRLVCTGRQAHGSTPARGSSAILAMTEVLRGLTKLPFQRKRHKLFSAPTLNVGMIQGGSAPNMVPGNCCVEIDTRYLPGQTKHQIMREIRGMTRRVQQKAKGIRFRLEVGTHLPPATVEPAHPMIRSLQMATEQVTGASPKLVGLSGTTVCKQLIRHGIPAVGFAPGDANTFHIADEYIRLAELVDYARILGRMMASVFHLP